MQNIIKMKLTKNANSAKHGRIEDNDVLQSRRIFGLIKVYKGIDAIEAKQRRDVQKKVEPAKKLK